MSDYIVRMDLEKQQLFGKLKITLGFWGPSYILFLHTLKLDFRVWNLISTSKSEFLRGLA